MHGTDNTSLGSFYGTAELQVPFDYDEYEKTEKANFDHARAKLKQIADSLNYSDTRHEVIWGIPKPTVLSYAEAQRVDLIVLGSHGKHGIARLLGSIANVFAHSARCDSIRKS